MPRPKSSTEPMPKLAPRSRDAHKGDFGRALLIGGSRGMSGSIGLSGMSALRAGAGLVTLAVPEAIQGVVAGLEPSYMTSALPADRAGRIAPKARAAIEELRGPATTLACGPGLGRSTGLTKLLTWLYRTTEQPLVLDADALNILAEMETWPEAAGPRILTPHPGEFKRLVGDTMLPQEEWEMRAFEFAAERNVVLILKGQHTLITDGAEAYRNNTGNPGMATGGSGDVLTGVITALLGQGLKPMEAARLGVHVHGLAGDLAAAELGEVSMIASDIIRWLPMAFLRLQKQSS